jgi:hypothetical protein
MPPNGIMEFWNNGQKIDIVPVVPAFHHSGIPIPRSLFPVAFSIACKWITDNPKIPSFLYSIILPLKAG